MVTRLSAGYLSDETKKLHRLQGELSRMDIIVDSRSGSKAMDYYLKRQSELERSVAEQQAKVDDIKARLGV